MFSKLKNNFTGFTLMEMMVVIAIIAILATMATVMLNVTRPASRDVKRISSVKQVQTALELYFADEGTYPPTEAMVPGEPLTNPSTGVTYLSEVPQNPQPADGECPEGFEFSYAQVDGGLDYNFSYCLSKNVDWVPAGENTANNNSVSSPFLCGLPIQYNGQEYNTVSINTSSGTVCSIIGSLNVGTMINGTTLPSNDEAIEKWCYYNDEEVCNDYGALYSWAEAMDLPATCNTSSSGECSFNGQRQGICPPNFHVASDSELYNLELAWSQNNITYPCTSARDETAVINTPSQWQCRQAADSLASYNLVGYGDSISGFNWEVTGYRTSSGTSWPAAGMLASAWSSTSTAADKAQGRLLGAYYYGYYGGIARVNLNKTVGMSIFCFQN